MAKDKGKELSGIAFVGFLFVGLAIGSFYDNWTTGALSGLAMGFLASLLVGMKYKD
ncbi:MAG: hypothetical protein KAJ88_00500 [Candidatus Aenigmarchaeota archaeon]|nr:hypothetical protein [Candidatus Aenigmarchaeota archaeon]